MNLPSFSNLSIGATGKLASNDLREDKKDLLESVNQNSYESIYETSHALSIAKTAEIGVARNDVLSSDKSSRAVVYPTVRLSLHPWQENIANQIYNENSRYKSWYTRELGVVYTLSKTKTPKTKTLAFGSTYTDVNSQFYVDIKLAERRMKGMGIHQFLIDQIIERWNNPSDYPLPSWPNGFTHGFGNADVVVITLLMNDLTPPDEWLWKSTLDSLCNAMYYAHSPNNDWRERTKKAEMQSEYFPKGMHKMPGDMLIGRTLSTCLLMRFKIPKVPVLQEAVDTHVALEIIKEFEVSEWVRMVKEYCGLTKDWMVKKRLAIKGMRDETKEAFAQAYVDVSENLGEAPYAYQIRFFLNTFVMPKAMKIDDTLVPIPVRVHVETDDDIRQSAVTQANVTTFQTAIPDPDIFDRPLAEPPPAPLPVATVTPYQPQMGPPQPGGTAPLPFVHAVTYDPTAPPTAPDMKRLRSCEEIEGVAMVAREFGTSGAATGADAVLGGNVLQGGGLYKGTIVSNDAALIRTGNGYMRYDDPNINEKYPGLLKKLVNDYRDTGAWYSGGWKNNLWHGHGTLHFPARFPLVPWTIEVYTRCIYEGDFVDGRFSGRGTLYLSDGRHWQGFWSEGRRSDCAGSMFIPPSAADRWAHPQIVFGTWPQDAPDFITISEYARRMALKFQNEHKVSTANEMVLVQLAHHGTIETPKGGGIVLRACSAETLAAFREYFAATNPKFLGIGKDARSKEAFNTIVPIAAFDIDYSRHKLFFEHQMYVGETNIRDRVKRIKKTLEESPNLKGVVSGDVCTSIDEFCKTLNHGRDTFSRYDVPLVEEINEHFLFHGGEWKNIWSILQTGFDESRAGRGLFGKGVYFAEDPGKCDQYTQSRHYFNPEPHMSEETQRLVEEHFGIDKKMFADAVLENNRQEIFAVLLCRVVLGASLYRSRPQLDTNDAVVKDNKENPEPIFYKTEKNAFTKKWEPLFSPVLPPLQPTAEERKAITEASNLNRRFNSIVGSHVTGGDRLRFREFVVYKGVIARPTHLIFYKRTNTDIDPNYVWPLPYGPHGCPQN